MFNFSKNASCFNTESSEQAIAKMKNLDESKPVPVKHKDVNTFKNNQVKFTGGASSIPPEHMKCNILKARLEEDMKKGWLGLPPLALTCFVTSFLCKSPAYCLTQWLGMLHFPCLSPVCLLPNPVVWMFSLVFFAVILSVLLLELEANPLTKRYSACLLCQHIVQRLGKSVSWAENNWNQTDSVLFRLLAVNKNTPRVACSSNNTENFFLFYWC